MRSKKKKFNDLAFVITNAIKQQLLSTKTSKSEDIKYLKYKIKKLASTRAIPFDEAITLFSKIQSENNKPQNKNRTFVKRAKSKGTIKNSVLRLPKGTTSGKNWSHTK